MKAIIFQFSLWDSKKFVEQYGLVRVELSILFMRFETNTTNANTDPYTLSILFMRFLQPGYYILYHPIPFQFSLWDSFTYMAQTKSSWIDFQFSLWDSLLCFASSILRSVTFNSLYEIQDGQNIHSYFSPLFFQFSLWDSWLGHVRKKN